MKKKVNFKLLKKEKTKNIKGGGKLRIITCNKQNIFEDYYNGCYCCHPLGQVGQHIGVSADKIRY